MAICWWHQDYYTTRRVFQTNPASDQSNHSQHINQSHTFTSILMQVFVYFIIKVYLESGTWPNMISRWIQQQVCAKFVQISEKVWQRPWKWLDEHLGKNAWAIHRCFNGKLQTHWDPKWWGHAHHFLWHKGVCPQGICLGRPNSQFHTLLWLLLWLLENVRSLRTEL